MKKRKTALILYSLLIDDKRTGVGVNSVVRSFMYTSRSLKYFASPCSLICYILSCNRVEKGYIDLEVSGLEKNSEMEYKAISNLVKEIRGYKVSKVTVSINGNVLNL